ncbi:glycosyltransferase family 2 protein [Paraglaciecola chathamensis]|uniref:Glycosyltransferase family 2 protein n=1 Tax=Paraglaciecola chathamensis TaxID=368405 RepID=A0ABS0W8J5_9ALTE|nr:glycosyltransferase family 2 protein [Paraglaciecola chathamensis]MBJ2135079.1 glycosyltransferase family 2 protein [Paraglaciecola chathamensis]
MKGPLISVVIPTYERADYLARACLTASQQTYKNIEIIVVDDNSTSSYESVRSSLESLNITYIKRTKNGGGSAARNTGIEAAKGEYIAFLDDDDTWEVSKLEKQMALISEDVQAAHCGYKLKSNSKIRLESKSLITLEDLKENNKLASTTGLLCKTDILRQLMFDDSLHRSQDWDLYLRIADITPFAYAQEALYIYDDGDHARMSNKFSQLTLDEYRLKLDMLKKHQNTLYKSAYNKHVAELILPSLKERKDKLTILKFCIDEIGFVNTFYHFFRLSSNKVSGKGK